MVINELMYYPASGQEFIELRNLTAQAIALYDPNHPDRDDVAITLNLGHRGLQSLPIYSTGAPLRAFFRTRYSRYGPYLTG